MTKGLRHSFNKKFNNTHVNKQFKHINIAQGIGRGISVNSLADFAGSHYRDDSTRHIHRQSHTSNDVSHHYRPNTGNEINNLVRADIKKMSIKPLNDMINNKPTTIDNHNSRISNHNSSHSNKNIAKPQY